jgi:hypothetical protein
VAKLVSKSSFQKIKQEQISGGFECRKKSDGTVNDLWEKTNLSERETRLRPSWVEDLSYASSRDVSDYRLLAPGHHDAGRS